MHDEIDPIDREARTQLLAQPMRSERWRAASTHVRRGGIKTLD
jgi:hypothetical protein